MTQFVTPTTLASHVGADPADMWASTVCAAVNQMLAGYPWLEDADGTPTDLAKAGALMLAGRLYRRKNSLGGLETLGDGGVAYVARTDPDISRLLGLDQFAIPKVG